MPIDLNKDSIPSFEHVMDILDYRLDADLIKKRTRYLFNGPHVDIDKYTSLRRAVVVESEGNRRAADTLYKRMSSHVSS